MQKNYNETAAWKYEALDISWIDKSKSAIAFAFDDGPVSAQDGSSSMRILKSLEKYKAHATFFYWGQKINNETEEEIKYAQSIGCEIANHTWTHDSLADISVNEIETEVEQCRSELQRITGLSTFLVRPPYLAVNSMVEKTVNVPMVTCSIDTRDWDNGTFDSIVKKALKAEDGDILLMHEPYEATAQAVEYLVPYFIEKGYQIVSVSELAEIKGCKLKRGQVYSCIR